MAVFQVMFSVSDHWSGSPVASLWPSAVGPRHAGQFPEAGTAQMQNTAVKKKVYARKLVISLFFDQPFQMAVSPA